MSADAKMVPVAWHIGPIFKLGSEKPGRFGADDSRWQPLYSAAYVARLKAELAARDRVIAEVVPMLREQNVIMTKILDAARAASPSTPKEGT